ncbi:OmpA family protein [Vibrio nomapromontoriensis]|uniref:MotY family protein n=1 Tax=Vibrio nomapromontoriensis TaxID=2910246 RepID=UPI003D104C94
MNSKVIRNDDFKLITFLQSLLVRKVNNSFRAEGLFPLVVFCIVIFWGNVSFAAKNNIPMDMVNWQFVQSEFKCQLRYSLSNSEYISFVAEPNSAMALIKTHVNYPQARLLQTSPPWQAPAYSNTISTSRQTSSGMVEFRHGIDAFLTAFAKGAWMRLEFGHERDQGELLVSEGVTVPSVRIEQAYSQFNDCRAALPSMSYEQARDVELSFRVGQRVLDASQRQALKAISSYIQSDKTVQRVLIDGHTDNLGSSMANLQLSRVRADDVASLLTEFGTPNPLIEVRAHGDRYPVSSNATKSGQAKNRRVTVRVIRQSVNTLTPSQDEKTGVTLK